MNSIRDNYYGISGNGNFYSDYNNARMGGGASVLNYPGPNQHHLSQYNQPLHAHHPQRMYDSRLTSNLAGYGHPHDGIWIRLRLIKLN